MNVGKWIIVHTLLKIDGVENLDAVSLFQKSVAALNNDGTLRVLSIRIEKKVNYFYEVTTSD